METRPHFLDPHYRHRAKRARPGPPLVVGTARMKWYDLEETGFSVDAAVRRAARDHVSAHALPTSDIAGFVILHRCGPTFHFLLTSLWRGNNELWQSVAFADPPASGFAPFGPAYPAPDAPRPTFCVWELGIVAHEAHAWQRFLHTARDAEALDIWQADVMQGQV